MSVSPSPLPFHVRYTEIISLSVGFAISSSLLVVINKWALQNFPFGATLTAIQFFTSALVAWLLGALGICEVDALSREKVIAFMPAVVMFYISVATNLKLLEQANVDTYLVIRSCVPLTTLGLEIAYLKAPVPDFKAVMSLVMILFGAIGYVATDRQFKWSAYSYAVTYLIAFTIDQVLIKKIVTDVKLTRWGLVYYNNFLAFLLMPLGGMVTGEWTKLHQQFIEHDLLSYLSKMSVTLPIAISCVFGISISFFALNCRKALTATAFTVLGVFCKFLTVIVNSFVWTQHSEPFGIFCVLVCIVGGVIFQRVQGANVLTREVQVTKKIEDQDMESGVSCRGSLIDLKVESSSRSSASPRVPDMESI